MHRLDFSHCLKLEGGKLLIIEHFLNGKLNKIEIENCI